MEYNNQLFDISNKVIDLIKKDIKVNGDLLSYLTKTFEYSANWSIEKHIKHISTILYHLYYSIDPTFRL